MHSEVEYNPDLWPEENCQSGDAPFETPKDRQIINYVKLKLGLTRKQAKDLARVFINMGLDKEQVLAAIKNFK